MRSRDREVRCSPERSVVRPAQGTGPSGHENEAGNIDLPTLTQLAEVAQLVEQWSEDQLLSGRTPGPKNSENDSETADGEQAGPPAPERSVVLSPDDRLAVAVARRGRLTLAEFMHGAGVACRVLDLQLSDEEYVAACERYADDLAVSA